MPFRVSKPRFDELVDQAMQSLPEPFAGIIEQVPVEVYDEPTPQQLKRLSDRKHGLLLGLYSGSPVTTRTVLQQGGPVDVIYIFQKPIEAVSGTEAELIEQVRKTVLHEIGHHFGLGEQRLRELGFG